MKFKKYIILLICLIMLPLLMAADGYFSGNGIFTYQYSNSPSLNIKDTTNDVNIKLQATDTIGIIGTTTTDDLEWRTNDTVAATINGSTQNVTFAGTVDGRDIATDGSKLDGIEALADVTDVTNVTAAGALMDSEIDADLKTFALPANTTISAFGATLIDDADATTARATLGAGDVSKVGTPVNNQLAIWTGDGTIEGEADLTWNGTDLVSSAGSLQLGDTASTYRLHVHDGNNDTRIVLGAGGDSAETTNYRRYIEFEAYDDSDDFLFGLNAAGALIGYASGDSTAIHKIRIERDSWTAINSSVGGAVRINWHPTEIYSGVFDTWDGQGASAARTFYVDSTKSVLYQPLGINKDPASIYDLDAVGAIRTEDELTVVSNSGREIAFTGTSTGEIWHNGNAELRFGTNSTSRIVIQSDGDLVPFADSTYDLGESGKEFAEAYIDSVFAITTAVVGGNATAAGILQINEDTDDGSHNATFTVPALAADTDYTLPPDDGDAGEQLQTDGNGVLTWEAPTVELATTEETTTGTDATRAVTPDGLAGSIFGRKSITLYPIAHSTAWSTGDGKLYFRVPVDLNGFNLVSVNVGVGAAKSTSGLPNVMIARARAATASASTRTVVDMLSTAATIDVSEWDSKDAATAPVINATNDDVQTGDLIRIDVDAAGTGTQGGYVTLIFEQP